MMIGNAPRRLDVIIGLCRLNRLLEHDHANLTASVEAGITMTALQQQLAGHNQFLAMDPPFPGSATIGGVIAANLNGTRRMFHGSVRDLVIGVKVALVSGEQIKGGVKRAVGDLIDDEQMEAEGHAENLKGKARQKANE